MELTDLLRRRNFRHYDPPAYPIEGGGRIHLSLVVVCLWQMQRTADATAILHKTWGKAALKTINAEVFVDHDMVMEEIAAYKKLHTDWKSKGSETWKTCHEEDAGLCQGMPVNND